MNKYGYKFKIAKANIQKEISQITVKTRYYLVAATLGCWHYLRAVTNMLPGFLPR